MAFRHYDSTYWRYPMRRRPSCVHVPSSGAAASPVRVEALEPRRLMAAAEFVVDVEFGGGTPASSNPQQLTRAGDRVFFEVDNALFWTTGEPGDWSYPGVGITGGSVPSG